MSRWAVLPAELDPRVRQLVVRLRRLKDHSGLSLRQLAARTEYSPKSWERYLGGRSLPPPQAVEALARIGGEDPTRWLALREVAAEAWGNRRGEAPAVNTPGPEATMPEATTPEPEILTAGARTAAESLADGARSPTRSLRVALVAGTVALVLAVSSTVLLAVRLLGGAGETAAPLAASAASAPASSSQSAPAYACRVARVDGRWYAGISPTRGAVLANGHAGPEVAEAQCLLRRAGISPGGIDGIFGPLTEAAVRRAQQRAGLVVDGIIGPHTWKALRR
ncbi:peptidoglycan-binding protein [Streptomyces sp. NBC_00299]|uniref:peptidoglycan-binding protein n=1 Tax=Streptomyces sp. NBC_00299 TaxID=2975705 RepID=UPI002E2DC432|nr:peptidoglycan-binding protein [Streptomyces sp. NBC_00299]